ncbi:MAG: hypothetical protein JJ934_07570 [Pseudomonadales bacterium]|nr:hypothetical protein [Pseudomonadales bacterium]MBO6566473.1 hypothetical protein [Pseudomonadales bacterium]MBO6595870.1 hypothetical protein [Pseudomonadales bacterium]MBO6656735.1 hypothetical protein [Pseudomonadales bacterium]MBO6702475.1 hypothetical protein [Pseudomonadales bacterium]
MSDLTERRKTIIPQANDTWETIAARVLPEQDTTEACGRLQSWNLHVFMRPAAPEGSPRAGNPILPSDIIFVEPPAAA